MKKSRLCLIFTALLLLISSACASFAPPKKIGAHNLRNLPKDAVLTCYEGKNEVTIHFFGGRERDTAFILTRAEVIAVFRNERAFWKQGEEWREATTEELDARFGYLRPMMDRCFKRFMM